MKQQNLFSLFFKPRQTKNRNAICDRCLKNNCGCHRNFMQQTSSKKIPFMNDIKRDYRPRQIGVSRYTNVNEFSEYEQLFSKGKSKSKSSSRTSRASRTIRTSRPSVGVVKSSARPASVGVILGARQSKALHKKQPRNMRGGRGMTKSTPKIITTTQRGKGQGTTKPKPKGQGVTTPFGGFGSAQAQEDALVSMIEKEKELRPEQFEGQSDEIILGKLKQEGVQGKFDTGVTTTGGNYIPYSMIEPANYPAKVFRHSKSANPLARFVEDVTVSYYGDDIDLLYKGHEAQEKKFPEIWKNIKEKDTFYTGKFADHDTKLVDLGKSVTEASEGGKFFGIPNQYLIIASLAIGVVALVMGGRR